VKKTICIKKIIKPFDKKIEIEGDKSLSIRWALIASQSIKKSISTNLLRSEDVLNTLDCLKKLGVKVYLSKYKCEIQGVGINGYKYKKKTILNAGNSGTLARLIMGLLVHSKNQIKIIGDNSLSKRDFVRVIKPLQKFGAKFKSNQGKLPLTIFGTDNPKPIKYFENKGSAQCKSAVMFAALNTKGKTIIKAKKSRNHTELLLEYLKIPMKIKKTSKYDFIEIDGPVKVKSLNYKIPSDISSAAFFIILTILSKKSKLVIKNININPSRAGILKILKMMDIKIQVKNIKIYKGEKIADLHVKSALSIKSIKCPTYLNTSSIDEFLLIFLVAARAKGVSIFKNLSELNQKESPRLRWGSKILNLMGIKTKITYNSIKIYGNPNLEIDKEIIIKNYMKDHRVFMTSVVAALTFGGKWTIHDKDSIKTSFPSFLEIISSLNN
jgi:3-phosphoshikimate 1-carboxyvinyltransferase